MIGSSTLRTNALFLAVFATVAATALAASPAQAETVRVVVKTRSGSGVESKVYLRIGTKVATHRTATDGTYTFASITCNAGTAIRIEPLVNLYVRDFAGWSPCQRVITRVLRPVGFGSRSDDKAKAGTRIAFSGKAPYAL